MDKTNLYICIKNPFTERDFKRMGVAELSNHFNLRILDCTPWLLPRALKTRGNQVFEHHSRLEIHSLWDIIKATRADGGYALDFVGQFSPKAILMFAILRMRNVRIVVMDSGSFPTPDIFIASRSFAKKIIDALKHGGLMLHVIARINYLLIKVLPDQRPQIAFVSGSAWKSESRFMSAVTKIPAHSFDYEVFRSLKSADDNINDLNSSSYALYLDEDIAGHEDNSEMGLSAPATAEEFYPTLSRFFDRYELISGERIVIAGYPGQNVHLEKYFKGREIRYNQTAQLVRNANLVFAHASTAISFAILWKKPLVFLSSKEIERSWYQPWIDAPQILLRAQKINIDQSDLLDLNDLQTIVEASYNSYIDFFIKAKDSPSDSLWSIVKKTLLQEKL